MLVSQSSRSSDRANPDSATLWERRSLHSNPAWGGPVLTLVLDQSARWGLLFFLAILLFSMANGKFGVQHYLQLQKSKSSLEDRVLALKLDHQKLNEEIRELAQGKPRVLQEMRRQMGYLEPGEKVVHFGASAPIKILGKPQKTPVEHKETNHR